MAIKQLINRSVVILLTALLCGCVSTSFLGYPDEWKPTRLEPEQCPNLTGLYRFRGDVGQNHSLDGMVRLDDFYKVDYRRTKRAVLVSVDEATHVQITGPLDGKLTVKYLKDERPLHSFQLAEHADFECGAGALRLNPNGINYQRTQDGALVSHVKYFDGMPIMFLVFIKAGSYWIRWELAPND